MLVQHRHSDTAPPEAAGEVVLPAFPQEMGAEEFVSWPLRTFSAAKTLGEPEPPSPFPIALCVFRSPAPVLQGAWLLSDSASSLSREWF